MINVSVRKDSIEVIGHAGYAPPGKDIVCAGVSVLTQTLISSIEALTDDIIGYEAGEGKAIIEFRNPSEQTKLLIDSFFIGVNLIADEYPDHVRIV